MDGISLWIAQMDFPWMTAVAAFLDNDIALIAVTLLLVLLGERRKGKIAKIALAVVLAVMLSFLMKNLVQIDRPCVSLPAKIACPSSYSFPSGHTIVAFTVMLAFINKPNFIFYFAYAVFVAFTRIYLGVHTFEDVAGSVALAPFVYYIADKIWRTWVEKYAFRDKLEQ